MELQTDFLCNCIYKIIVKLRAFIIKGILLAYASQEKFTFLEGWQIHDVIGIAQEFIHAAKNKHLPSIIVNEDIS